MSAIGQDKVIVKGTAPLNGVNPEPAYFVKPSAFPDWTMSAIKVAIKHGAMFSRTLQARDCRKHSKVLAWHLFVDNYEKKMRVHIYHTCRAIMLYSFKAE